MKISNKYLGPEIIIAGPGTGKTYTLINKIKDLIIEYPNDKLGIIVCTFTRKASEELQYRLYSEKEIKPEYLKNKELLIGTIHSISFHLLKEFVGDEYSDFEILAEDEQINFIHSILLRLGFSDEEIKGRNGWQLSEELTSLFNKITDEEIDISQIDFEDNVDIEEYCSKYPFYLRLLKRFKRFDYATIQKILLNKLNNNQDILSKIQEVFQFVFVDEYQDVNNLQDKLLKKIASKNNNITVVGDDDQSIYGFRGGNVEHIINFKSYFEQKDIYCKERKLLINRRSTKNIIKTNKLLIDNAKYKRIKKDIQPYRMIDGEKVSILGFENDKLEAEFIVNQIKELVYNQKVVKYSDIGILFRSVKNHSERIKKELFDNNIPFSIIGAGDLFSTSMGEEFISLIELFISKDKNRISNFYDKIEEIESKYASGILSDYVNNNLFDKLEEFLTSGQKFNSCLGLTYEMFNVVNFIKRYQDEGQNIGELTNIIKSFDEFSDYFDIFGLYSYVKYLASTQKVNYFNSNKNSISLLTIHQAKGLEYPVVFLASQNEREKRKNLMDKFNAILKKSIAIGEERRLFYVACSRAENLLYITFSKKLASSKKTYNPVTFINELLETSIINKEIPKYDLSSSDFRDKHFSNNEKLYLSYNRVALYNKCPLHYYFQNVLNLQTVKIGGMIFGNNIHKIIERVLKMVLDEGININAINISNIIDEIWDEKDYRGFHESEKYKKAAYSQINNLVNNYSDLFKRNQIYSVEETFNINLKDVLITGRFDYCRMHNDEIEIIDFKTGDESDYTEQLSFYNYCFQYKNGIKPTKLYVYFLKTGRLVNINPIPSDNVLQNIISVTNQIKQNIFFANKGKHCKSCAYSKICEIYTK